MNDSALPAPIDNKPIIEKPVWYRILRVAIISTGSIAVLIVLLMLLLVSFTGGLGALVLAVFFAPYINGIVIASAILFLIYYFLYALRWKKEGYAFGKIILLIGVLSILPIGIRIYSSITVRIAQISYEKANPVMTGVQSYDFSKDVVFHTGKAAYESEIQMRDNVIVWPEFTKQSPPYRQNVADLFVFSFNLRESSGAVAQASHFDASVNDVLHKTFDNPYIVGGKVYWLEGYAGGSSYKDLIMYDPLTGRQTTVLKDEKTPIFLDGGTENYLMIVRGITKSNGYTGNAVSLYDVSTKQESPLDEWSSDAVKFGTGYFCHATSNNSIGIYDIEKKQESIVKTAATERESGYGMIIAGCSKNYIVYSFAPASEPGTPAVWESHYLTLKNDGSAVDKPLVLQHFDFMKRGGRILVDNYLFYANTNALYRTDLSTGKEIQILALNGLGEWNTDGDYLVYQAPAEQGKSAYHLKKINP